MSLKRGDTGAALWAFSQSQVIRERLVRLDPNNAQAQRDLAVSYSKQGDSHSRLGNAWAALWNYLKDLEIAKSLARDHPKNAEAQHDLSYLL